MKLYRIANWAARFENNRTRELKQLAWVPIPNSHDGDGYTSLVCREGGPELYGAWIVILQVASKCRTLLRDGAGGRGTLLRDSGKPHDADSLSRMTRFPVVTIEKALLALSAPDVAWLEVIEPEANETFPQDGAGMSQAHAVMSQATDEERKKGMERTEGKEGPAKWTEPRVLIGFLNEKTGRHFRETSENLTIIRARLDEAGVSIEGVKQMIERQCIRWKGTDQEEYLRPETLFRKSKFDSYYAAKDQPINPNSHGHKIAEHRIDRSVGTANAGTAHLYRDAARRSQEKAGLIPHVQRPGTGTGA